MEQNSTESQHEVKEESAVVITKSDIIHEDSIVHLEFSGGNAELLKKIASQDAECQTILEELISNLGDTSAVAINVSKPEEDSSVTNGRSIIDSVEGVDKNSPINITSQTEAIIDGKKYVLVVNADNNQICAYPVVDSAEDSGTCKKGETLQCEQLESVTGTSAEIVSVGPQPESQTDAAQGLLELSNTASSSVRKSIRKRKICKGLEDYETKCLPQSLGLPVKHVSVPQPRITKSSSVVKRPRGRPRRYPPQSQSTATKIPAVIIPSPSGQTLMLAPIKGLQNLQAFQQQMGRVPPIAPYPATTIAPQPVPMPTDGRGDQITEKGLGNETSSAVSIISSVGDERICRKGEEISTGVTTTPDGNATVLRLSEDQISQYTKHDPPKLGLKATEGHLENMKCCKCDFQAYFVQQYQDHISTHTEHVHKCKCCQFLSFDPDEIISHTRRFHPRCICDLCDFVGEYAYVVRRHMSRHSTQGFLCRICGKVYKDQYILKMHIKMVHMPAEVLFECTICDKKFTRKAHLKRHIRTHEPNKPYQCSQCSFRGTEKSDIFKHSKVHEEPQFGCDICGKQFRQSKNRDLHLKRHRGQKDYKCGICNFFGYTFTDIRKHIERKHFNHEKMNSIQHCVKCNVSFSTEAEYTAHMDVCLGSVEQTLSVTNGNGIKTKALLVNTDKIFSVEQVELEELEVDLEEHGVTLTEDQLIHTDSNQTVEPSVLNYTGTFLNTEGASVAH